MDLIERYLGAVRWNLPAGRADDIVAELADDIASRIEAREDALDRPLTRDETSALLKEFGHPIAVAGRYHGQRALIGPEVFPFYWFVLKVWLAIALAIKAVQLVASAVLAGAPMVDMLRNGGGIVDALLVNAAIVTLIFAVIERTGWLSTYLDRWKPEELPRLSLKVPPRRRWEAAAEIGFGIAFILWWSGAFAIPIVPDSNGVAVRAAPIWASLYWPVIGIAAIGIVQGVVRLAAPTWRALRGGIAVLQAGATIALAAALYGASHLAIVTSDRLDPTQLAEVQRSLDLALNMAVVIVPIAAAWHCAVELWRLYRER